MQKKILVFFTSLCLFYTSFSQSSLQFDASAQQYVQIGNTMNTVLAGTNTITAEAWVYMTARPFLPTIVGNYTSGTMQFLLRVDNDRPAFWISNGALRSVNGSTVVPLNTWTHLAGVWDGSELRVYINGVLDGTATITGGTLVSSANPVRIGANLLSEAFTGRIDEVRIWRTARTGAQIAASMNTCYIGTTSPNLLANYNFEEGSGTTVTDRTGHGYNGSFVNAPTWNVGVTCAITLPVSFTGIHAENKTNGVSVSWEVGMEQDILRYVVERSADGNTFSPIGYVNAAGASVYSFQDTEPWTSAVYYRIKSEELSGMAKYSSVVKVADANTKPAITIAPNPANGGRLNLQLLNKPAGKYTARIVDLSGKVQFSQTIQQTGSNSVFNLVLPSGLTAGMYILQVTNGNKQTENCKFYYQP